MWVSPFKKKATAFGREKTTYESFKDYFATKMNDMFLQNLPSDDIKAMSPEYLYPIGGFALMCLLGIFIAVFTNGYMQSLKTEFLSPSSSNNAMKNCVTVPTINTGTFLATQNGIWQGQPNFEFGEASYVLSATSLSIEYDDYVRVMNDIYSSLLGVKHMSQTLDLASNLVWWMSGVILPFKDNTAQRLSFVGTPLVVFDRQKIVGTMSNVDGACQARSKASFDNTNGKLVLHYDHGQYVRDPTCMGIVDPVVMGYVNTTDYNDFSMQFDVRSLITCVAVNMGIVSVADLVHIPSFDTYLNISDRIYNISSYYDSKYSGMDPIYCMQVPTTQIVGVDYYVQCTLLLEESVYVIPLFNHIGRSADGPQPCNCTELTFDDINDKYDPCNLFFFLSGALFYPTNDPYSVIRLFLSIGLSIVQGELQSSINGLSYYPQWIDGYLGMESPQRETFNTPAYRQRAYSFCDIPGVTGKCSFVTFSLFDRRWNNWAVSEYYLQVQTGACQNTFVGPYEDWRKLIDNPFAPLTQDYQKCHYDASTVTINQAGSSVGTVSILAPLCITFILVLCYFAQSCGVASIKKTYTNTEKSDALDDFALKLLLTRDRDRAKQTANSVLAEIVDELGEDVPESDVIYRANSGGNGQGEGESSVKIDWVALQEKIGLRRRQPRVTSSPDGADKALELKPVASPIHFLDPTRSAKAVAGVAFTVLNDYEVTPALLQLCRVSAPSQGSPKTGCSPRSGSRKRKGGAAEVPPSPDERMELGQVAGPAASGGSDALAHKNKGRDAASPTGNSNGASSVGVLDVPALFALLDALTTALDSAEADRSKSAWSVFGQTAILRIVEVDKLPRRDASTLYFKLSQLLELHGALMLNTSADEIKAQRAAEVAYIVGTEVLTLADIRAKL